MRRKAVIDRTRGNRTSFNGCPARGTPDSSLTPKQAAKAERIYQAIRQASEQEQWRLAQLLDSKPKHGLLGEIEYQVRDLVHRLGASTIQAALEGRKKVITGAQAGVARPAASRPGSWAIALES